METLIDRRGGHVIGRNVYCYILISLKAVMRLLAY